MNYLENCSFEELTETERMAFVSIQQTDRSDVDSRECDAHHLVRRLTQLRNAGRHTAVKNVLVSGRVWLRDTWEGAKFLAETGL